WFMFAIRSKCGRFSRCDLVGGNGSRFALTLFTRGSEQERKKRWKWRKSVISGKKHLLFWNYFTIFAAEYQHLKN
ncbi:MAG: hypothetical protein SO098_03400, partial [Prevotella sp.]|nr:hypothetical protein [Prevotella sp.]